MIRGSLVNVLLLVALLPAAALVRGACTNHHGDRGVCVSPLECDVTNGIRIGNFGSCVSAGGRDRRRVCCKRLPCSGIDTNDIEDFVKFGLRRFPRHAAPVHPRFVPPSSRSALVRPSAVDCGLNFLEPDHLMAMGARDPHIKDLGSPDPASKRYPWLLALWKRFPTEDDDDDEDAGLAICGAALVSSGHAITAAHCVVHGDAGNLFLRGGTNNNVVGSGVVISVRLIHVHESFDPQTFENDIAVLALENVPLSLTSPAPLYPVCLPPAARPSAPVSDYTGETVLVAGWGCVDEESCLRHDAPVALRDTVMPIVDNDLAMCWFMNDSKLSGTVEYIPERVFVVGGDESGSRTTCRGDSGSPVVRFRQNPDPASHAAGHWEVIGIVSWSRGCGRRFRPSVWTRVQSFVPWVKGKMREDGFGGDVVSPSRFFRR